MSNNPYEMLATLKGIRAPDMGNTEPSQTANLQTTDWAAKSQQEGHWNDSMLQVTLNAVRQSKSDEEIHL